MQLNDGMKTTQCSNVSSAKRHNQTLTISLDVLIAFVSALMILKAPIWLKSCHAHIKARPSRDPPRHGRKNPGCFHTNSDGMRGGYLYDTKKSTSLAALSGSLNLLKVGFALKNG
jgi:hypothetical protein